MRTFVRGVLFGSGISVQLHPLLRVIAVSEVLVPSVQLEREKHTLISRSEKVSKGDGRI